MVYTRRDIGKIALASVPLVRAYAAINSKIDGVQIGAITYCFRSFTDPEEVIKAMVEIGLGEAELMSNHCEGLAGAPAMPSFGRGRGPAGPPPAPGGPPPAPGAAAEGRRGGRVPLTPEQQAQMEAAQTALAKWRASATADTWKAVRKKFNSAGIEVALLCYN